MLSHAELFGRGISWVINTLQILFTENKFSNSSWFLIYLPQRKGGRREGFSQPFKEAFGRVASRRPPPGHGPLALKQ